MWQYHPEKSDKMKAGNSPLDFVIGRSPQSSAARVLGEGRGQILSRIDSSEN